MRFEVAKVSHHFFEMQLEIYDLAQVRWNNRETADEGSGLTLLTIAPSYSCEQRRKVSALASLIIACHMTRNRWLDAFRLCRLRSLQLFTAM